jgi:hypothetical protein
MVLAVAGAPLAAGAWIDTGAAALGLASALGAGLATGATVTGVAVPVSSRLRKNLPLELNTMALIGWPLA